MNKDIDICNILKLYTEYDIVYGPYLRYDGRKHIILVGNGKKRTISYPKALVEIRENRRLEDNETVDHNDRDYANDDLDNLVIRNKREHSRLDVKRRKEKTGTCLWCGKEFILTRDQYTNQYRKKKKTGPFCSRPCSGKYGKSVQSGGNVIERKIYYEREYYRLDKDK